jgi:hypothetical protein
MRKLLLFFISFAFLGSYAQEVDTLKQTKVENTGAISISASELEEDDESQDISGLLQSSKDIFVSTAGYTFGSARFKIRGLQSENTTILFNGTHVNDAETGRAYWSTWGGLNDVTRNKDIKTGLTPNSYTFGGIGGVVFIDARASHYRKGIKATYSSANRSYRNRIIVTGSTGMMDNGWALTVSGSRRWAQEGYVEGTFYDAWGYFLSAEKKINSHHSIGLVAFGAPSKRGKSGISVQEAYNLADNNYYNPYWGFQNGEKRNSRVSNYHKPMITLNHYWTLNEKTNITTGLSYSFGRGGSTALDWYDVNDPRPDYYKNLPSYYDEDDYRYTQVMNAWQNHEAYRQLNWDDFYFANRKNLFTVENANGVEGSNYTGMRSKYIVEERRNDHNQFLFNTVLNHKKSEHLNLIAGFNASIYKGHRYKTINDLLGGDYYLDVDKYAERDFEDEGYAQSDLNNPNRIVGVGDIFGYDYIANINTYNVFGTADFTYSKVDFTLSATLSNTNFWRTGNMKNGKFPDNSYGDSEKQNFFNYGLKAGATYKLTGRHFLNFNAAYLTRAPYFRNAYTSARTRNDVVNNLESEKIISGDASYIAKFPFLQARLTAYYTYFQNGMQNNSYYHEYLRSYVNYIMNDLDKKHYGLELGLEGKVTQTITLTGVASAGRFLYASRPNATISVDNSAKILVEDRTVYINNYHEGSMPEFASSVGIKYRHPKYWFLGANFNYYDEIYLNINPDRRTEEATDSYYASDPQWNQLLDQTKLNSAYTVDLYIGKSIRINHKYYISINLNLTNVLDNKEFQIGGYEQYRYDANDIDKFAPRNYYMYGRMYFLNINLRM